MDDLEDFVEEYGNEKELEEDYDEVASGEDEEKGDQEDDGFIVEDDDDYVPVSAAARDRALISEIQVTCSALGCQDKETGHYLKEPDCIESVKDLIRYLRRDRNESMLARRYLGAANIVARDLIPLLVEFGPKDNDLFDVVLRLMVNLTQSAAECMPNRTVPSTAIDSHYFIEVTEHLHQYKRSFANVALFDLLASKLTAFLDLDWEKIEEEDRLMMERILMLIRNVLLIPPTDVDRQRTDHDITAHDLIIRTISKTKMTEVLLRIASCDHEEQQFLIYALEIIALMLREQKPEELAKTGQMRSEEEIAEDVRELHNILSKENAVRKAALRGISRRPSRFPGTYVVADKKAINDKNNLIVHKPIRDMNDLTNDTRKKRKRIPKNRAPVQTIDPAERKSTCSVRCFLKDFTMQISEKCFNKFIRSLRLLLSRERNTEEAEVYYQWLIQFFMAFARCAKLPVSCIRECMSVNAFHSAEVRLNDCLERMHQERRNLALARVWGQRAHIALKCFRELLLFLNDMSASNDKDTREMARSIKHNVFYVPEYREMLVHMMKLYNPAMASKLFLYDLIETIHYFVKMIEVYSMKTPIVVQKRTRKGGAKKKKQKGKKNVEKTSQTLSGSQKEELWDEIADELSAALKGDRELPDDVVPFDSLLEKEEEKKLESMRRIKNAMMTDKEPPKAVALLRAAREIFPGDAFGGSNALPDLEFSILRTIFDAELPPLQNAVENEEEKVEEENSEGEEEDPEELFEEEEELQRNSVVEQVFSFAEFLQMFAHCDVIRWYIYALENFATNSTRLNHFIVSFLHRIAFGVVDLAPMLYQARLFRIFQKIIDNKVIRTLPETRELFDFAKFLLRKFFANAKKNPKIFTEILFWKRSKDCFEIEHGYGSYKAEKQKQIAWTEDLEEELQNLFDEFQKMEEKPEGKDVADYIEERLPAAKTRRQIIRQMRVLGLDTSVLMKKKRTENSTGRGIKEKAGHWTEEQTEELRELYDEYKNMDDPVGEIMQHQKEPRPRRRIVRKLVELGLVAEKAQLAVKKNALGKMARKQQRSTFPFEQELEYAVDNDNASVSSEESERSDRESSESSSDEDEDEPIEITQKIITRQRSDEELQEFRECLDMLRKEHDAALDWLIEQLNDVATDRTGGRNSEPIPLVPVLPAHHSAMDMWQFQQLLRILCLSEPVIGQEQYWRIPSFISSGYLNMLVIALESKGQLPDAMEANLRRPEVDQQKPNFRSQNLNIERIEEEEAIATDPPNQERVARSPSSSASENNNEAVEENSSDEEESIFTQPKRARRAIIDSDDE